MMGFGITSLHSGVLCVRGWFASLPRQVSLQEGVFGVLFGNEHVPHP